MQHLQTLLVLALSLYCSGAGLAQPTNLGNPPVLNFLKKHYKAGTQSWDIAQDRQGVTWFANNDGLLEFDGLHWRLHPLDNGTIVRAVQAGNDGRIYVGGQGDFGYFGPDAQGQMQYHSLKTLVPEQEQHFSDVWDVLARPEGVFFRANNQVFRYHAEKVEPLFPGGKSLYFMGVWGQKLLVQDHNLILYVFENDQLRPLQNPNSFTNGRISAVLALHPDTLLVTTIENGIFCFAGGTFQPWKTQHDDFIKTNRIYCAELLPNGRIALGTSLNGLVVLDRQRRIFHHLNKKGGLQNNTVLSLFARPNGSVWLGLDNGIDFVDLNSPFSTIFPDGDLQGTGYTAQVFGGNVYFGTNTGLYAARWKPYYSPEERQHFSMVQHSGGQVWSLTELEGALLMGHHEGAFAINGLEARRVAALTGVWRFLGLSPQLAVAGHYGGLSVFRKTASNWMFEANLEGLVESSRLLAKDEAGNVWMAHPYRGVYRIKVHPDEGRLDADFLGEKQGLPSNLGNHLFQLDNQVVFAGEKGVFDFDPVAQRFVPNEKFNRLLGANSHVKYLRQDAGGRIWYATDRETGVLLVENDALEKKVRKLPIPELANKMTGGFQFLLPVDDHNVFVATGQGFIHLDLAAYMAKDSAIRLVLHEVRLKQGPDSLLFGGHATNERAFPPVELPCQQNSLVFSFSATDYPGSEWVRYAHFLEGAELGWSGWNSEADLFFNNLPPGDYVLHIKAQSPRGTESPTIAFAFTILPPWYASRAAYAAYVLCLVCLMLGVVYRQQKRFEREKQQIQHLHQNREAHYKLNAQRSEEAINRLQNEKLEAEVQHKTQELATATMHLLQKNEILNRIKEMIGKLKQSAPPSPDLHKELGRMIKMMEQDARIDADWEHFSQNFDQVHSDFLKRLGEQYPELSPNDYKLCAYLRLNLQSKEIAALMSISLRGVEASRYRLRKKLKIDTDTNLTEFLMRF